MPTVYRLLDADARRWWYHRELRDRGQLAEARKRERESIRSSARSLAAARSSGWLTVGRGGWTLHYEDGSSSTRIEGYGGLSEPMPQAALALGIPVIDSTTIPDRRIALTTALPLATTRKDHVDKAPWGGMSWAPLTEVAAAYKALGATLYNLEVPPFDPRKFRAMTRGESKALTSFSRGDELGLFEAMVELEDERSA